MEEKKEYATFGRQVGYLIGTNIATALQVFIQLPILTRAFGAGLYGTWSLINLTVYMLFPFAVLGLSYTVLRFLAAEKDVSKIREEFFSVCVIVFVAGTILSLLLFFLSDFLAAHIFRDVSLSSYIRLASGLILLNAMFHLLRTFFRLQRKMGLYSIITITWEASNVGLIVLFILLGYKLNGAISALLINGVVFNLIVLFIILKQIGFQLPRFTRIKSYLRWGIPLTPNEAILWIINSSDRYMVSYFMGVTAAGIYNAAYSMGNYASFALTPLIVVLYPNIVRTYEEGDQDITRNYFKYSIKYLMLIAIPSAFALSLLAKPLLQIITTPEFVPGSSIVPYVGFGVVLFCFYQTCVHVLYLFGKTVLVMILLSMAAGLNIILNIILIPHLEIFGAALATLVTFFILGTVTLMVSRRYFKFGIDISSILKSILASAAMAICIWLINPDSIATLIISIPIGAIVYLAVLLLLRTLSKGEITFFMSFLKNMRRFRLGK